MSPASLPRSGADRRKPENDHPGLPARRPERRHRVERRLPKVTQLDVEEYEAFPVRPNLRQAGGIRTLPHDPELTSSEEDFQGVVLRADFGRS